MGDRERPNHRRVAHGDRCSRGSGPDRPQPRGRGPALPSCLKVQIGHDGLPCWSCQGRPSVYSFATGTAFMVAMALNVRGVAFSLIAAAAAPTAAITQPSTPPSSVAPISNPTVARKGNGALEVFASTASGRVLDELGVRSRPTVRRLVGYEHTVRGGGGAGGQRRRKWCTAGLRAYHGQPPADVMANWSESAIWGMAGYGTRRPDRLGPDNRIELNGGLYLFVRTVDGRLLTSWQAGPIVFHPSPKYGFGGWLDLGSDGQIAGDPSVAVNTDGGLEISFGQPEVES
jgi:hypothetical protein